MENVKQWLKIFESVLVAAFISFFALGALTSLALSFSIWGLSYVFGSIPNVLLTLSLMIVIPLVSFYFLIRSHAKKRGWRLKEWLGAVAGGVGLVSFVFIILATMSDRPHGTRDSRRISDLKQLQLALELYADQNGDNYPPQTSCTDISFLDTHLAPLFIPQVPRDRLLSQDHPNYQIAIRPDRKKYVVKAVLEDPSNTALNEGHDVDGNKLGCDCNDPVLCYVGEIAQK